VQYLRNFAYSYLSERCLLEGGEYLSAHALQEIRSSLDHWVCMQIKAAGGLNTLLAKKAPQWHQVGRVCFHLAENKNDPDFPFVFMATYAPKLSEQGRIRHQALGRALQEYAGAKNKKVLTHLPPNPVRDPETG